MACTKKVCKECPFRRASAPGYLGEASYDPHGFIAQHWHGKVRLPCHMSINWEKAGRVAINRAPLCLGFLTFAKNNVKYLLNKESQKVLESGEITEDRINIFGWFSEFVQHHGRE